ncbi:MAG: NB-ARC domain-containing protein [Brasilonema sp.]
MTHLQQRRQRGVLLTAQGLKKLQAATSEAEVQENHGIRYTLEALSDRTSLDPHTLIKVYNCEARVDKRTLSRCFSAFHLQLEPSDYYQPFQPDEVIRAQHSIENSISPAHDHKTAEDSDYFLPTLQNHKDKILNQIDWGEAPDVSVFFGRTEELANLEKWIIHERCRLVALLGMGGVGKTYLSVKLATQIQNDFEFVIWRSLRNAPPIEEVLADILLLLSNEQETHLPETLEERTELLIRYLKLYRCLLVLDNAEILLQNASGNCSVGHYRQGYEGYGKFLKRVGKTPHQSCVVLTSREKPKGIGEMEGETLPVRILQLGGLQAIEVQEIFKTKGSFYGSTADWSKLVERYAGHPLALNIVSTTIQKVFDGNISEFLNHNTAVFGELRYLLKEHFDCLSEVEKQIIISLSLHSQPASFSNMREKILPTISPQQLLEALESLQGRSLISQKNTFFSVLPLIREYAI